MDVTLNGSSAANYSVTRLRGSGISAASGRTSNQTYLYFGLNNGPSSTSNTFTNGEIYIPNYNGSANKCLSHFSAQENNQTEAYIDTNAGLRSVTDAITSVKLNCNGFNFVSGSSFFLYGIKNS